MTDSRLTVYNQNHHDCKTIGELHGLADAMRRELLRRIESLDGDIVTPSIIRQISPEEERIAEMEAHLKQARDAAEHQRDMREQAEAALAERTTQRDEANTSTIAQRREFEKALAERERMLRLAIASTCPFGERSPDGIEIAHAVVT